MVTDYDCWHPDHDAVTVDSIIEVLNSNSNNAKKLVLNIINNISNLCKLPAERINLKAKTTEKLGVIGHEKAIASEVIVTVVKYD